MRRACSSQMEAIEGCTNSKASPPQHLVCCTPGRAGTSPDTSAWLRKQPAMGRAVKPCNRYAKARAQQPRCHMARKVLGRQTLAVARTDSCYRASGRRQQGQICALSWSTAFDNGRASCCGVVCKNTAYRISSGEALHIRT